MKDYYIREGATFEETFTDTDTTADTLTLTVSNDDGGVILTETVNYAVQDEKAIATISTDIDLPIGTYSYMYTITYEDGFILKLPDPESCNDNSCDLPGFIVCDANDVEGS